MNCIILHENQTSLRFTPSNRRMTLAQADQWEAYLSALPGVKKAKVRARIASATVLYAGERKILLAAIARFRYDDPALFAPQTNARALAQQYEEKLVGLVVWQAVKRLFLPPPLRIIFTCWTAGRFLWHGFQSLIHRQLHAEVLDAISIGISLLRRDFSTASSVMFLLKVGELLEEWTRKKSVTDLAGSMALQVDRVWLHPRQGPEVLVPLTQIQPGDILTLRAGGVIPLDGCLIEGEVMVNQVALTGESLPVAKGPGSIVYAGTAVEEGEALYEVRSIAGSSRYDQIIAMIESSEQLKSQAEHRAASLADRLVPFSLLGTALTFALTRNISRAVSILMVDFSCALKLAMPLAVLSAMREAGGYHITVKGGKFLEAVAQADTIVLDKTGTLTKACPRVADVIAFGGNDPKEMLRIAACLEEHFPHSMANAVVRAAAKAGLTHEEMHAKVEYVVAHGISSTIQGQRTLIGSRHFVFEDNHCHIPAGEEEKFDTLPPEMSHLYLAIGGTLCAVICVADTLRKEASTVVHSLQQLGLRVVMMTGDNEQTAAAIARQVGIEEFQAGVLPEDKAAFVTKQRQNGHIVLMVGDGINDSPALSAANAGIAIQSGAAIARQIADITIGESNLAALVTLRRLSTALLNRIDHNYKAILLFNGSLILLGAAGVLAPTASAFLHNGSTLAFSLHSMTNLLPDCR